MQPQVELRDVKAEELHHPLESRDSTVAQPDEPPFAVRLSRIVRRSSSSSAGPGYAVVVEPPPHERELAAIRLELIPRADLRRVFGQRFLVAC